MQINNASYEIQYGNVWKAIADHRGSYEINGQSYDHDMEKCENHMRSNKNQYGHYTKSYV